MTGLSDLIRERRARLRRRLLAWYRQEARDLPWRSTSDPYRIWLSETMLQQTRVETVISYYHRFLERFPTVDSLAAAREEEVLKLWEGLGYYSRARNLHRAAKEVARNGNGGLPRTVEDLERLPGIGRYTAGAIASIAFGVRAPVLDGNVKRVYARIFGIADPVQDGGTTRLLWGIAEEMVPRGSPGDFNQALMELGARVCIPRSPRCEECPVEDLCEARRCGAVRRLPARRARRNPPTRESVAVLLERRGRFLLAKRPSDGLLGGLWEFPGGDVAPGETVEQAAGRCLRERFGVSATLGPLAGSVRQVYSHFIRVVRVHRCTSIEGEPAPLGHPEIVWAGRQQCGQLPLSGVDRKIARMAFP